MKLSSALLTGFAAHATLSEVILKPVANKAIVLEVISATSDKSASVIQFLTGGAPGTLAANAAVSATTLTTSSAFAATLSANNLFYVFNTETRTGEIRTLSSKSGAVLTFSGSALAVAYPAATTQIFKLSAAGSIPVGNATKELLRSPGVITMAPVGRPLVIRVDSTSAGAINHILARLID
jgi:hypothetical protein